MPVEQRGRLPWAVSLSLSHGVQLGSDCNPLVAHLHPHVLDLRTERYFIAVFFPPATQGTLPAGSASGCRTRSSCASNWQDSVNTSTRKGPPSGRSLHPMG